MSTDQKQQLEQMLWDIANTLRGRINADEYRNYILGIIFFKYLSESLFFFEKLYILLLRKIII
jgi:type I restriction enzyme M protein